LAPDLASEPRIQPRNGGVPARLDDEAYVGRTWAAGEWFLAALASVFSTFHVRAIVFCILMTHASRPGASTSSVKLSLSALPLLLLPLV